MKFWRSIKWGKNMRQLPKREEFLFILLVSSQIKCLISIFNTTIILNSMVKIENKQPNHLLCRFNQLVLQTTCDIPGDITLLNFMVKLVLWHLGPSTGLVRDDNCLDWNCNKNNTTSVHYRRLALQREANVYRSFHFGSLFLEPSKMQHNSRQDNVLWCVRT